MELFKEICKVKGLDSLIGIGSVDSEENRSIVLLNGVILPSNHTEYQGKGIMDGKIYRIRPATCGHDVDCQIGKPKSVCVKNGVYSVNKCAVYYLEEVDVETYKFGFTSPEIESFIKEILK